MLTAEKQTHQPLETSLDSSFKAAMDNFYGIAFEPGFSSICLERGVDVDATDSHEYWRAVADFAYDRSAEMREAGKDESDIALMELYAAAPSYFFDQATLDSNPNLHTQEKQYLREDASYFQGLLKRTVKLWPDITASTLSLQLMNIANISIEDRDFKQHAANSIRASVKGAQHEIAFGQLLENTGRNFREATVEEDVRGIDYVVERPEGGVDYIDVKASLKKIENHGRLSDLFARKLDGGIVMHSLLRDSELGDNFHVSEQVAAERAQYLERVLTYQVGAEVS